ncbi:hypothetical protein V1525DRAFT_393171 [Lipomyces kononenkoae]|uniref:Uncharacterized protein n=1 Tax=Lipomyces kononenkoae TaxID=34357 RepID=A0ACC3TCS7_LIPKO
MACNSCIGILINANTNYRYYYYQSRLRRCPRSVLIRVLVGGFQVTWNRLLFSFIPFFLSLSNSCSQFFFFVLLLCGCVLKAAVINSRLIY